MSNNNYGILLNEHNIKFQRQQFAEMVRLLGVNVKFYPIRNRQFSTYQELVADESNGFTVGVVPTTYVDQWTRKKLGWVSELSEGALVLNFPYNTPDIEVGCVVLVPSGIDNSPPRMFRISRMSTVMIYPASIACECVPEYENILPQSQITDFRNSSTNILMRDEDDNL